MPTHLNPHRVTFAALMELYETNYLRLRRLCPRLDAVDGEQISSIAGACDLHLAVLERTPYTTRLQLTHQFGSGVSERRQPNLSIRMFHDARQAEVVGRHGRRRGEDMSLETVAGVPGLAGRWRHNRFLFKWLGFCLSQGHRFDHRNARLSVDPRL